jgi:PAS domain S-box-containing protein
MPNIIDTDEFYQTINLMIAPMMLTNEAGAPAYLNRAFLTQIGYAVDELPDRDSWFKKAYPNSDYRKKIMKNWDNALIASEYNESASILSKIYCADGAFRWFDVHQQTIANKRVITFLNVDELKERNEELANLVQLKETLLTVIAHDVRSPLGCVKQIISSYHQNISLSEKEVEEIFFKMNNQVDYIFNILNSLLMRNDQGRFTEQKEPIHLEKFFAKYLTYYKERLRSQNIRLVLEFAEDAVLNYDPGILDIVCRNLLDNAIKFTSENGVICISFKKQQGILNC